MLFQPLIEFRPGWLERLLALLESMPADAVYRPWNASALHMLCYRKDARSKRQTRVSEQMLLTAAQALLDHGAKQVLNSSDIGQERTALLQAAADGRLKLCRLLLSAGADATLADVHGQSMLDYLFYLKHSHMRHD